MVRRILVSLFAVVLGLVVAAPALAQATPTVKVATDATLGKMLVDGEGKTLYLYSRDEKGVSNCYDQCEARWPILRPTAGAAPTGSADIAGTLGTISRKDGTMQVTYNEIPLYYWFQDEKAGDTKGQAVGGVWWIVAPGLNQITPAVPQPSPVAQASPAAQPAPAAKPTGAAPVASPAALPRTGGLPFDPMPLTAGVGAAGIALTALGGLLLRRRSRRS
jgi:predicted lipoprotein with Yx(FWY)xxD motif